MSVQLHQEFTDLVVNIVATTAALLALMAIAAILRRFRWGPIGPEGLVEWLIDRWSSCPDRAGSCVNVEFRDFEGQLIDLGCHVKGELQHGRGKAFELREGVFMGCDPRLIRAGRKVTVTIEGGLVRMVTSVKLDPRNTEVLFVEIPLTAEEVLGRINGAAAGSRAGTKVPV